MALIRKAGRMVLFTTVTVLIVTASAKDKGKPANPPQDQIDILANLPLSGGPVIRLTMTRHYSRSYIYLEHASHNLTLVDVTDLRHPSIVSSLASDTSGSVLAAAGDAALISSEDPAPAPVKDKTITIVSFSDRSHPQTIRQFHKVTCTAADDPRGVVYVANDEGLWILHRNPAEDPEVQERYAHEVLYNH